MQKHKRQLTFKTFEKFSSPSPTLLREGERKLEKNLPKECSTKTIFPTWMQIPLESISLPAMTSTEVSALLRFRSFFTLLPIRHAVGFIIKLMFLSPTSFPYFPIPQVYHRKLPSNAPRTRAGNPFYPNVKLLSTPTFTFEKHCREYSNQAKNISSFQPPKSSSIKLLTSTTL